MDEEVSSLRTRIEAAFERCATIDSQALDTGLLEAIETAVRLLDAGALRVAEPDANGWRVNEWLKKAVLLYFRTHNNRLIEGGYTRFFDKVPLRYQATTSTDFEAGNVRIVPHAIVRHGAYVAANTVLMPCYVNIGAYVDTGAMIDTWA